MNTAYAFLRLTWRPAFVMWASFALIVTAIGPIEVGITSVGGAIRDGEAPSDVQRALLPIAFLFPAIVGLLIGRVIKELQHCEFAWSLPGLRSKLAASVLPIAAITAVPSALVYWNTQATFVWPAMALLALLVFSMAMALFDPVPTPLVSRLTLVALVVIGFRINDVTSVFESQPLIAGTLAAVGAGLYFVREFSTAAARHRPFVPTWPLGTGGEGRWMRERMSQRTVRPRDWRLDYVGTRLINWVRATEYESYGHVTFGWIGRTVTIASVVVAAMVLTAQELPEVAIMVSAAAIAQHFLGSSFLKKRMHRPLSRTQRAQVAIWSSFVNNGGLCVTLAALIAVARAFAPTFTSLPGRLPEISGVFWPVLFVFTWTPLLQWVQVRYLDCERSGSSSVNPALWMVGVSILFYGLVVVSTEAATRGLPIPAGLTQGPSAGLATAVVALALAGLVQLGYWLRLQRFFRTADLV